VKRLLLAALRRAVADAVHRYRVRRAVASLDGCDFCPEPGDVFIDVTPSARHITARLACWPCANESLRTGGARVLMGADGRPVGNNAGY
jgi:hypothetical protein